LSVIFNEFRKTVVRMASSKFNFKIFFVFFGVRRWYFDFFGKGSCLKLINGNIVFIIESHSQFIIEILSKYVAVCDSENSFKKVHVSRKIEIFIWIIFIRWSLFFGNLLSFDENSLHHSTVHDSGLSDVDGLISQVVVNQTRSYSIIFCWILAHRFLKETAKS